MDRRPGPGLAEKVAPGLRRILAPNPSPMTHWGTNTYVAGDADCAVIDPGPDDDFHLAAILDATFGRVSHIVVTHAHRDHSALAPRLAAETGAPVLGFGPPDAGRRPVMQQLARAGLSGGGEGVDRTFHPDRSLGDGDMLSGRGWQIEAIHTPGHFSGHLSLALGDTILTGDHVMGWASTLISPPDGDLGAFMASCERLKLRDARLFLPGHGPAIGDPAGRLDWLISHRRARTASIVAELADGPATATELAARIYTDTPAALLPAATRNVFAHLIELTQENKAAPEGKLSENSRFRTV